LFARFPGQVHQFRRRGLVQVVERAQVADVAQARTAHAGLESADLGGRAEQLPGDVLDGQATLIAQLPEPPSQLALPHRQAGAAHDLPLGARPVLKLPVAPSNGMCQV